MLSSDLALFRRVGGRAIFAPALAVFAALLLSACTVQPLYGPSATGQSVNSKVTQIAIEPVTSRVAQVIRNKLIFDLSGGAEPSTPLYTMRLSVSAAESALGVTPIEAAPAYSLTVSATYEVVSVATGDIVLRGTSRGTASYDRITQVYANTRAQIDAEDRAATQAADDIRTRLAAAAAKGTL